jgi:hypothetical protein
VEPPLFGVVRLQSASSLTQKEFHCEHLVVRTPTDDRLDVPPCRSHQLGYAIRQFCNRESRKLLSRCYELRDAALSLLGVEDFVVDRQLITAVGARCWASNRS